MRKNKFYSLLLSLIIAFGLWEYVVSYISTQDDNTFYNIPVVMEGESVLREQNLMITDKSSETVSLHLSGARNDLSKVNSGNITVRVDLSSIDEPGVHELSYSRITYPGDVPSNALTVESRSPGSVYVTVDYRRTKDIPVTVRYIGNRADGYIYDTENAVLDNTAVNISGPATVVDQITDAVIEVDLSGRVESISESFRYTLCDAAGEPVDAQQITTNLEEVRLDMQIQQIKVIELTADIVYAGGATPENTTVTIEPSTIRVSGGEAVLAALGDTYSVGTINLAELEKAVNDLTFTITLPEGVTNQTGVTEAMVRVQLSGLKTKEFTLERIEAINVPAGMEAEIINASISVKVRGPVAQIDALTAEDIAAQVDFTNAEAGNATYRIKLTFGDKFPNVGALKTGSVSATVKEASE